MRGWAGPKESRAYLGMRATMRRAGSGMRARRRVEVMGVLE